MTLKQSRLKEELKKSKPGEALYDIAERAGYSKKARMVYRPSTQKYTRRLLELSGNDIETLKEKYELVEKIGLETGDLTNVNHSLDSRVRMQGGFKDKLETNNLNPDKIIIAYGNKPISDEKKAEEIKTPTEK